jgi:hypothetical protein
MKQSCIIREDLQAKNLGVPITNPQTEETEYHYGSEALPFQWEEDADEQMQIFKNGRWYNAYSIDFDFPISTGVTQ